MNARGSPIWRWSLAIVLAGVAWAASAIEFDLVYQRDAQNGFVPSGIQQVEVSLTAPAGEWTLPAFVSEKPVFATVSLGDRQHLLALDKAREEDAFYSKLYFDANANKDLTDDPVQEARSEGNPQSNYYMAQFDPVSADIVVDGVELPYAFIPMCYCFLADPSKGLEDEANWRNFMFYLRPVCAYRAEVKLGDAAYTLTLGDANANGRFDDRISVANVSGGRIYGQGDGFYLVPRGEQVTSLHSQVLAEYLAAHGTLYRVTVDTAKGKLTLEPVTDDVAMLTWPAPLAQLEVYQPDGGTAVMVCGGAGQAPVPPGDYRLVSYRQVKTDPQGDTWQLMAMGTTGSPVANAVSGQTAPLKLGEPFHPIVTVPAYSRQNIEQRGPAQLDLKVEGSGGEIVGDLQRVSGNKTQIPMSSQSPTRPAEPAYKIISEQGEVVASGSFEYG